MNIKNIGIIIEKFVKKNAPTLLMSAGLVSFGGALYATGKATVKSVRDVDAMEETPSTKEVIKAEWKNYIPAGALTVAGVSCVITANHLQLMRIETLAAAYALNKDKFEKYRDKVKEVLGDKKETEISDKLAQDVTDCTEIIPWEGDPRFPHGRTGPNGHELFRCIDGLTGQQFWSNAVDIDAKVNEFNAWMLRDGTCSVNEWLDVLGCEQIDSPLGDMVWNCHTTGDFLTVMKRTTMKNGEPVIVLDYTVQPKPSFLD